MNQYEIKVKSNVDWGEPVLVRILSKDKIADSTLNRIKEKNLDEARRYCQNILKATFLVIQ